VTELRFEGMEHVITPALVYYYEKIEKNIEKMIRLAGNSRFLWPHIKTYKCAQVIQMQMDKGIDHFKCATVAEAELAAECGARDVLIAYPMVGPNIQRFVCLQEAYPRVRFWTIGDDLCQLRQLGEASALKKRTSNVLIDINPGLNRTGVSLEKAVEFYQQSMTYPGLNVRGLHCYDGQRREKKIGDRYQGILPYAEKLQNIRKELLEEGYFFDTLVVGTTPSFPCFVKYNLGDVYFSPGTLVLNDAGYSSQFPDMGFEIAAAVMTRVVSKPVKGQFTLDLGVKGISTDSGKRRGRLIGVEHAVSIYQNEEHWVFGMEEGYEDLTPLVGDILFVIPEHICPTCALYSEATVIRNGKVFAEWEIAARDRKLNY
jgi:D-serine deaminase-like pyridoxal phosphate-dependent protein